MLSATSNGLGALVYNGFVDPEWLEELTARKPIGLRPAGRHRPF